MATWKVRQFKRKKSGREYVYEDKEFQTKEEAEAYASQFNIRPQVYKYEVMNGQDKRRNNAKSI
ncbi:hypothetical protein DIY18_09930 [Streptococcus iniae]|uniref:hypothetical protein n=1 Tax=Streptococcus iniae TaxID=1346 RepID=UPI000EF7864C|nr:hypothetical protein [Streptococcus iniae]RLU42094.1 hypothetical protein DIY18_09930 [Streptococcus iniae]RMI47987.1 hypothetical protein DIY12_09930 [Streptococcus iniae]